MNLLQIFSIGAKKILEKNCCVKGKVTAVQDSYLHVIKKPVRLAVTPQNTILSYYITFSYCVNGIPYTGKLYVDLRYRCPQKGEEIDVYTTIPKNRGTTPVMPLVWVSIRLDGETMLKYKCLVLDHDDTVVQTMRTLSYPFWCLELEQFRPGTTMTLEEYILKCYQYGFGDMCKICFHFTDEELALEHKQWMGYVMQNVPAYFPGIDRIIRRQREEGGLLCVVSHSSSENIARDYRVHFGIQPDAIYGWDMLPYQRKPNPWPLQDIMERFVLQPEDILVVDDMKLACMMAEPLGIEVAFAGWDDMGVPELREEMQHRCAHSFNSTEELEKFLFE